MYSGHRLLIPSQATPSLSILHTAKLRIVCAALKSLNFCPGWDEAIHMNAFTVSHDYRRRSHWSYGAWCWPRKWLQWWHSFTLANSIYGSVCLTVSYIAGQLCSANYTNVMHNSKGGWLRQRLSVVLYNYMYDCSLCIHVHITSQTFNFYLSHCE